MHWLGSALAVTGIAFVIFQAIEYSAEIEFSRFNSLEWFFMGLLTLIYGAANLMLVVAWRHLLTQLGVRISGVQAIKICGSTQIAKYVPGNIFHFVGRQALGMAEGLPAMPLAKSAVWEIGLIAASACLMGIFTLNLVVPTLSLLSCAVAYLIVMAVVLSVLRRTKGTSTVAAFVWYTAFLSVTGLLFIAMMELVIAGDWQQLELWLPLGAAYVFAWLVGLVTPGAPAGIGVRELVLLYLLQDTLDGADLMLGVLLGRITTVGGDVLFFGFSKMVTDPQQEAED